MSPGSLLGPSTQSHQTLTPLLAQRFHPLSLSHLLNTCNHMFNSLNWIKLAQQQFSWILLLAQRRKGKGWIKSLPFINVKLMLINRAKLISPSGSQQTLAPVFLNFFPCNYVSVSDTNPELPIFQFWLRNCLHSMSFHFEMMKMSQNQLLHKLPVTSHLIISRT